MKQGIQIPVVVLLWSLFVFLPGSWVMAEDVTLETSADCFEVGDTVSFTLTNDRDSTIYMPHEPPWLVYDASADTLIFPSTVLWVIVPLGGNSSATYEWDQRDYHLNQVPEGTYSVKISYSEQLDPWDLSTVSDTFDVKTECPGTGVETTNWGSIKRLFR
jgi:hypothetical protein